MHINYFQNDIPSFKDVKNFRQSNTSPARNRRGIHDNKSILPKTAIKRNLFGDQNEEETSTVLAKQLTDSPQNQQSCSLLMDPAIQSIKCNEFNYKAQTFATEIKGSIFNIILLKFIL